MSRQIVLIASRTAVLYLWEWVITTGEEATHFWNGKLTGASVLFFLNRYLSMGYLLMNFLGIAQCLIRYV
ncbi:hypothetical protein BD309DRAFT_860224 [Dichomitus squalens]|uniref:Uncharacterized protein n=1 Tax=Dichomitus squalens TaxID=114155 RepID=A0A4Q9PJ18_9APHY|nr:hypothetical protein BD309DRAFT_860224 [Dichomitus squalens]TBU54062.1 hypothetical protein BD310DRAFT_828784 [Dichomitus squalens]